MGWYDDRILPKLQDHALDSAHARRIRARVTASLAGEVVQVGFGTGHNLSYLPPRVTRLLAVEPSKASLRIAAARIASSAVPIDVIAPDAQRLPLPDASVDAALCTWSMCSIPDPVTAVAEVHRVLRPGGQLHFVEHGLAPDDRVQAWQRRLEPVQKRVAGGCHLTRPVTSMLTAAGFTITEADVFYEKGAPKSLGAITLGTAVAP